MNKQSLPKKMQYFYDIMKSRLSEDSFAVWYENAMNFGKDDPKPLPSGIKRVAPTQEVVAEAIQQARQAVSSYSPTNGARKAVEALADALEQAQAQ